ncbi:hypothetical protein HK102_010502, partial [Quaeritorhiza haematococci]
AAARHAKPAQTIDGAPLLDAALAHEFRLQLRLAADLRRDMKPDAALERLDAADVERAVLLAPALSPGYDLTRALERVRRDVVVFWSPLDVFFLGVGTGVFGTSDRVRGRGAGLVGFRTPGPDAPPRRVEAYAKLRQVRWTPAMSLSGYFGGHLGPDSPRFLSRYVVPLLRVGGPPGG